MTASAARTPRSASLLKRERVSFFGHYSVIIAEQDAEEGQQQERQLQAYIDRKNSAAFRKQFSFLAPLLAHTLTLFFISFIV